MPTKAYSTSKRAALLRSVCVVKQLCLFLTCRCSENLPFPPTHPCLQGVGSVCGALGNILKYVSNKYEAAVSGGHAYGSGSSRPGGERPLKELAMSHDLLTHRPRAQSAAAAISCAHVQVAALHRKRKDTPHSDARAPMDVDCAMQLDTAAGTGDVKARRERAPSWVRVMESIEQVSQVGGVFKRLGGALLFCLLCRHVHAAALLQRQPSAKATACHAKASSILVHVLMHTACMPYMHVFEYSQ